MGHVVKHTKILDKNVIWIEFNGNKAKENSKGTANKRRKVKDKQSK
jgi:hypothetical protein